VALCNLHGKNDNYMEKRPTPEHWLVAYGNWVAKDSWVQVVGRRVLVMARLYA
jgi:hypothetical protein